MDDPRSNRILSALPKLRQQVRLIHPDYGAVLIEQNQSNDLVYFPMKGAVMSLTRSVANGTQVEVGVIGFEGIGAIASILDPGRSIDRAVVQAEGDFCVMPLAAFNDELGRDAEVRTMFFRYTNAFLMQVAQSALCNRLHLLEQRLARWLLMMHDRVETDDMRMTQEFLAAMLGTRLAGVNEGMGALVRDGVIAHTRQRVTMIDRDGLEHAACECYAVIRDEMQRLTL